MATANSRLQRAASCQRVPRNRSSSIRTTVGNDWSYRNLCATVNERLGQEALGLRSLAGTGTQSSSLRLADVAVAPLGIGLTLPRRKPSMPPVNLDNHIEDAIA